MSAPIFKRRRWFFTLSAAIGGYRGGTMGAIAQQFLSGQHIGLFDSLKLFRGNKFALNFKNAENFT